MVSWWGCSATTTTAAAAIVLMLPNYHPRKSNSYMCCVLYFNVILRRFLFLNFLYFSLSVLFVLMNLCYCCCCFCLFYFFIFLFFFRFILPCFVSHDESLNVSNAVKSCFTGCILCVYMTSAPCVWVTKNYISAVNNIRQVTMLK